MKYSFLATLTGVASATPQLSFVVSLFRHGARTPCELQGPLAQDPAIKQWVDANGGPGALTWEGQRQHETVGRQMRHRYVDQTGFVNGAFQRSEVHAESIDIDRCIHSAAAQVRGMFGPASAVPVMTRPIEEDFVLRGFLPKSCPAIKLMHASASAAAFSPAQPTFDRIAANLGVSPDPNNPRHEKHFADTLSVLTSQGLATQHASQYDVNEMNAVADAKMQAAFSHPEARKLGASQLAAHFLELLAQRKTTQTKMVLMSAHDETLIQLLIMLNQWNGHFPTWAAQVILEVWNDSGVETIRFYYNNGHEGMFSEANVLSLPGCGKACTLPQLEALLQSWTMPEAEYFQVCHGYPLVDFKLGDRTGAKPAGALWNWGGWFLIFAMLCALGYEKFLSIQARKQAAIVHYSGGLYDEDI